MTRRLPGAVLAAPCPRRCSPCCSPCSPQVLVDGRSIHESGNNNAELNDSEIN